MSRITQNPLQPPARIGIIGGGQLGKMITVEAKRMGYHVTILDPTPSSPAGQVADKQIIASFMDVKAIKKLARGCDVITYEFEHIDAEILIDLEPEGYVIYPSGKTLKNIQDKFIQKTILKDAGVLVPDFFSINGMQDISTCIDSVGLPFILKSRTGGYDGKGNILIKTTDQFMQALEGLTDCSLMAERFIDFEQELSIIVAKNIDGEIACYPIVENIHENSILRLTKAPAVIEPEIEKNILDITHKVMGVLDDCGVFCIEMFLGKNGDVFVNEIAPRPHNSGHYTIEACVTSQFEQLVRIITGMPLGSAKQREPCVMVNILGDDKVEGQFGFEGIEYILGEEDLHLHIYGKQFTNNLKKIGHITVLNESIKIAEDLAMRALSMIRINKLIV